MCFHFTITKERTDIAQIFHANWEDAGWEPVFHADGFSFPSMPVITQEAPCSISRFNWGLIPPWIKNHADAQIIRAQTLNARAETIFEKPSFRQAILHQRCLVIADGFFEWMQFQKKKYPHYIFLKDHAVFCFAGLYSHWTDTATGEMISSFSIITTSANAMMERIHNIKQRMPVILSPAQWSQWLKVDCSPEAIRQLLQPYPEENMRSHTISKLISSRTHNSNVPELLEPYAYPELQLLF